MSKSMALVEFYRGLRKDQSGRTLEEILHKDRVWLEQTHDYIQWLFPLTTASGANLLAPILSQSEINAFQDDMALRERLSAAFHMMLKFYGFKLAEGPEGKPVIVRSGDYDAYKGEWLRPFNHNYLRITRILKCLTTLGLPGHAREFFACLETVFAEEEAKIGSETFAFWRAATRED